MIDWFSHLYPYTNIHELNLDWIISTVKAGENEIKNFVGLNTIKYADPILWNITSQYEANTVVVDGQTGNAYISVQPVPVGVALSRTEYWTAIFNYGTVVDTLMSQIASNEGLSQTATQAYAVGDLVFVNSLLYKVIAPMIAGDAFVVGSNTQKTTIDDEIKLLSAAISANASNITTVSDNLGTLANLTTTDKSSVVNAINEVKSGVSAVDTKIGNLSDLVTTDKDSIVDAINEVAGLHTSGFYNVLDYGAVNDGTTDCSTAIMNAITDMSAGDVLYFPSGSYTWHNQIIINKSMTVLFAGALINYSVVPTSMILVSANNVTFKGVVTVKGVDNASNYFMLAGAVNNLLVDLVGSFEDFIIHPVLSAEKCDGVVVSGGLDCKNARMLLTNGCSNVEMSGVTAYFTKSCNLGVFISTDTDPTHTYNNVRVHDNKIDGNNYLSDGAIVITRTEAETTTVTHGGYIAISDIWVYNNIVKNGIAATDGIDVLLANNVYINNNRVSSCLEGIAILSNVVTCSNNVIDDCRSGGVVIGDYNIGTNMEYSAITINDNIVVNCGSGSEVYTVPAGIGAKQQRGCKISTVYVHDNQLIKSPYGFYLDTNTGGSNIVLSNNFVMASTAPISVVDMSQMRLYNNPGINPIGFVTIGSPATTLTNNFGSPIELSLRAGTGADTTVKIDGITDTIVPTGALATFVLAPSQTITLTETPLIWSARGI